MAYLSWLLMWFEAISGLKINLAKSKIILVGGVGNMEVIANEWLICGSKLSPLISL